MAGYIGNIPVPQATQSRQSFTATASQTTFATVGYTAGFIDVYLNGVHLLDGTDYTATNGSDIVLTTGAALNDVVEFVAYETFSVLDQSFTGTTTVDVLSVTGAATGTDLTLSGGVYLGGAVAANYLDDYEEGTWTPTYVPSGTNFSSITYNTGFTTGTYIKIGNTVVARGYIRTEAITVGSASGGVRIGGIPFVSSAGVASVTDVRSRGSCTGDNFAASAPSLLASDNSSAYFNLFSVNAIGSGIAHVAVAAASAMATGTSSNVTTFTISYVTDA